MSEELLPATWTDNLNRRWTCHLPIPLVDRFCREQNLGYGPEDGKQVFSPNSLHAAQLFDLAFLGSRHCAMAQGEKRNPADPAGEETRDEFLKAHENGTAYWDALRAARSAVINFILRQRIPSGEITAVAANFAESENALHTAMLELIRLSSGRLESCAKQSSK